MPTTWLLIQSGSNVIQCKNWNDISVWHKNTCLLIGRSLGTARLWVRGCQSLSNLIDVSPTPTPSNFHKAIWALASKKQHAILRLINCAKSHENAILIREETGIIWFAILCCSETYLIMVTGSPSQYKGRLSIFGFFHYNDKTVVLIFIMGTPILVSW